MTSADLAIVLGRFPTRQAAYAAAREHEVFRAALREVDLNYGLVAANSEMGRRRQEEIDAVLAAFVLVLEREEAEAAEAAGAVAGGSSGPDPVLHDRDVIGNAARLFAAGVKAPTVAEQSALSKDDAYRLRYLMDGGLIRWSEGGLYIHPARVWTVTVGRTPKVALRWRESEHGSWLNPVGRNAQRPPVPGSRGR